MLMKPSDKLKQYGWTTTIPVSIYPDGNGLDVEVGENLIVTIDGEEYECQCLGWKLMRPLYDDRYYVVKTNLLTPGRCWVEYTAPLDAVQIVITRREALIRGLITVRNDEQS